MHNRQWRPVACFLLALSLSVTAGHSDADPGRNLGFEAWDDKGNAVGWWAAANSGYRLLPDCDDPAQGKCSIKLESLPDRKTASLPVVQNISASFAAGHVLKLTGMIRTEDVRDGRAALWMRVDARSDPMTVKMLVLENMERTGPKGTTAWSRYEIAVPVAANATHIGFGLLLIGSGRAWFDDLSFEVDKSVTVAKADIPALVVPPRPAISTSLADDESLALPSEQMPAVKTEWRDDVRKRHHAIRSLFSEDFSDLQFLKPLLKGKRVVQLGESGHGVAEFNWLKVRLTKFLHREMGFDVVAFESSLSGCDVADQQIGKRPPIDVMRDCIFQVWHSSETLGVFEYLDGARMAGQTISLAGFDTQNSGKAREDVSRNLVTIAGMVDVELAREAERAENRMAGRWPLAADEAAAMVATYERLANRLASERDRLRRTYASRPAVVDLAIQESRSRVRLAQQMSLPHGPAGGRIRDEGMADNLDFLLDTLYPGRKVIVWAHNFHIAKRREGQAEPQAMGAWVDRRRGAEVYTVGLYMGRGVATTNSRERYEIKPPPAGTMEAILANAGRRMSFVDFSGGNATAGSWMHESMTAREWGTSVSKLTPAKTYDAVIYIDTVTPPEYK